MAVEWSDLILLVVLAIGLMAAGWASIFRRHDAAAVSVPDLPSGLVGTWHGSPYEIATGSKYHGATLTARFENDGTWTAVETREGRSREFSGTWSGNDDRVLLDDSTGRFLVRLTGSGNRLHGQYAFYDSNNAADLPGNPADLGIELTRAR
jgi:hypothetical protein